MVNGMPVDDLDSFRRGQPKTSTHSRMSEKHTAGIVRRATKCREPKWIRRQRDHH